MNDNFNTPAFLAATFSVLSDIHYVVMVLALCVSVFGVIKLRRLMKEQNITMDSDTFEEDFKAQIWACFGSCTNKLMDIPAILFTLVLAARSEADPVRDGRSGRLLTVPWVVAALHVRNFFGK